MQITKLCTPPESDACELGIAEQDMIGIPHDHQRLADKSIGGRSMWRSVLSLPEVVLTLVEA